MARLTLARVARARPTRWVRVAAVAAVLLVAVSAVLLMRRPPKKDDRPANAEGVEAFVAGLDGATRRAGRTGAGALAAFADAGRQMLTATPVTAPSVEAPALESVVQEGSVALGQDVEAVGRAVRVMLSEVEGSIPWL